MDSSSWWRLVADMVFHFEFVHHLLFDAICGRVTRKCCCHCHDVTGGGWSPTLSPLILITIRPMEGRRVLKVALSAIRVRVGRGHGIDIIKM